jgi:hypothetical protein
MGKIAVALYMALSVVWVYWILDRQLTFGSELADWLMIISVGAVHVALGYATARRWALLLPLFPVLIAVPLGYPSANEGEPLPIWLGLLYFVPFGVALVAIGVGLRRLMERRHSP